MASTVEAQTAEEAKSLSKTESCDRKPVIDSGDGRTLLGRSLRIPDASLQTSVYFPRTRPLKCMEQTTFLFNLNQERTEMKNSFKITVKHIISYALFMK